ncbi:MAG: hydantoinase B/oxoprolinase family protein [Thermoplasmata archaeon]
MNPVLFEVIRHSMEGIPERMGAALQRSAFSANIKERKDESCAVFSKDGKMVAQAEHIPVHLGAMPSALKEIVSSCDLSEGDQVMINDPYKGGTHLPDITVVKPFFFQGKMTAYLVNRAHHADVGGLTPGSMPGDSVKLEEEGVVIPPVHIVKKGVFCRDNFAPLSETRNPGERMGDIRAQIGANEMGAKELLELIQKFGPQDHLKFTEASLDYSEERTRKTISKMEDGTYSVSSSMEWGGEAVLRLELTIDGDRMHFDFQGTSPQVEGNINAPLPVTLSAVYYVVRCLIPEDIPMNQGVYQPLNIYVPKGTLLNPLYPAAVSAGNVETSQRVVELILDALRSVSPDHMPAQCQGTMNNVTIGNRRFTYYETIGGGAGASSSGDGASGVHVHMTNTMNTPVESMEHEYPVKVVCYKLRKGSGGVGLFKGGDGIVREIEMLEDAHLSIQSERRVHGPEGLKGGRDGLAGRNLMIKEGEEIELGGHVSIPVKRGWRLRVETPGGGGWGHR